MLPIAYLDAGTGSMLLQLLVGGIAAIGVAAKFYWRGVMKLLRIREGEIPAAILLVNGWRQARKAELWDGGRQVRSWGPGAAFFHG